MKKVLLGMSGGVDSSVAAILLKEQGYKVVGVTMEFCDKNNNLNEDSLVLDAKKVCNKLGIEHHVVNLKKQFNEKVIDYFVCTYMSAKTPNPCVECNKYMKFGEFYKIAKEYGCDYIATGHYAKCSYSKEYNQYILEKATEDKKDQSYFLYGINKEILPYIIFPLSGFKDKEEIRKIAEKNGLDVAKKKDSQEICFIPDNDYINFLNMQRLKSNKKYINLDKGGNIVLSSGEILGTHNGLIHYTIGQRKGLGVSYKEPLYVVKLIKEKNEVVVGPKEELYSKELYADELNFLIEIEQNKDIEIEAKIRYRSKPAKAILKIENGLAKVCFNEPQRAITPGQSVVFYLGNIILGGGKIKGEL